MCEVWRLDDAKDGGVLLGHSGHASDTSAIADSVLAPRLRASK